MPTVILFNGFLGSGKDRLCAETLKYLPEYHRYALSDTAKDLASQKYHFPREWADIREEKDRPRIEYGGQSVRDLVRSICIELDHVNQTQISEEIATKMNNFGHKKVIITDFRLERDFHYFVKAFGRKSVITVKITRSCVCAPDRATHFEEYALENFTFDHTIANDGTPLETFQNFYKEVFPQTHQGGQNPNFYYIRTPSKFISEIRELMNYYEFESQVVTYEGDEITRMKANPVTSINYKTVEDFLLGEIFYRKPNNLYYFPISNPHAQVVHFETSPYDLIANNPITHSLCSHPIYGNYLNLVSNYGTFIRLSENKVQRLYWNLPLNAGLPLTPKEKDPVAEMVFLLHDYGHFLLPDLIFTGQFNSASSETNIVYVCWRLLGESITIVLSEMLLVAEIKDNEQFRSRMKIGFDKPYQLYELMEQSNSFKTLDELKSLFWASYQYFCAQNPEGFLKLANCGSDHTIWKNFNHRYLPISQRGKTWTQGNIEALKADASYYQKWWKLVEPFAKRLQWQTVTEIQLEIDHFSIEKTELAIMRYLFERVWDHILKPMFSGIKIDRIGEHERQSLAFQRLMLGNLLLFVKLGQEETEIIQQQIASWRSLKRAQPSDDNSFETKWTAYKETVLDFYQKGLITANEYHNAKTIYLMIPPNMLKKLTLNYKESI